MKHRSGGEDRVVISVTSFVVTVQNNENTAQTESFPDESKLNL